MEIFKIKAFFITLRMGAAQASLIKLLIDAMAENGFNTLCIELEKGLRYNSHPELSASWALSIEQIKEIISCCHAKNIAVIPLVPLFSHVSYITDTHPEFIEPSSKIYCTDSKEIYKFIFEILDEVIDIFKPRFLHIGHDEALTNYDPRERTSILTCPACSIKEPFNVLASDIKEIHSYLKNKNIRTMMWADGLLDPENFSGASFFQSGCYGGVPDCLCNAIDLLPRDIIMCDWHYEPAKEFPTVVYLQKKGFETIGCPNFEVNSFLFTDYACKNKTENLKGMMATSWCRINRKNFKHLKKLIEQHGFFFKTPGKIPPGNIRLKKIKEMCGKNNLPFNEGEFRKIYTFNIDGSGIYHSSGWRDLRYMEWPGSADPMKGPRYPSSLEIKALRHGYIDYTFTAKAKNVFDSASLKIWMACPGKNLILLKTDRTKNYIPLSENKSLNGHLLDLSGFVKGLESFQLRFEAENLKTEKVPFLKRFEIKGKIINQETLQC